MTRGCFISGRLVMLQTGTSLQLMQQEREQLTEGRKAQCAAV